MGSLVKWFPNVVEFPHTTNSDVQIYVIRTKMNRNIKKTNHQMIRFYPVKINVYI